MTIESTADATKVVSEGSAKALGPRDRESDACAQVAELWLKGFSYQRIANETGLNRNKVRRMLDKAKQVWLEKKGIPLSDAIAQELRRIDMIEMQAWAAWEKSQKDFEETKVHTTSGGMTRTRTVRSQVGDSKFLEIILKCIDQRCKLLGVYKPPEERAEMTVWGVTVVIDTPEQLDDIQTYEQFKSMVVNEPIVPAGTVLSEGPIDGSPSE